MNYRHVYHAGNFADVAKHAALIECLIALKRKDKALFALDSHAGRGVYDLRCAEARKSGEAERGVQRLLERGAGEPALAGYIAAVGPRRGSRLARYPGSAALIAAALRRQDRATFVEALPTEARALRRTVTSAGRVRVEIGDGYAALKAHLPPAERRGVVLIDPPYESVEEWRTMLRAFAEAYRRWPTGTYLVWYPILGDAQRRAAHARLESLRIPKLLSADLAIRSDEGATGLAGSGLMIVNPPFGLDARLREAYSAIHRHLADHGAGYAEVTHLTPERMAQ
ncbi:MAG TPA: 23S rRNA (adenine(2030)-N(6))-methyltransferase RlmJ [Steroidobacteraceae bacterium]|nr:23S rRNA (adenine(2030)-N(6))-methyltransferase RlmJ [Steroidobacteraceae bacterium]